MKKILYTAIIICLVFTLSACENEAKQSLQSATSYQVQTDFNYRNSNPMQFIESDRGFYFLKEMNYVYYRDKESTDWIPLCDKPQCGHNSQDCNAYLGDDGVSGLMLYRDHLYYVVMEYGDASTEYAVCSMELDGSHHQKINQITLGNGGGIDCTQHRGYIYYSKMYEDKPSMFCRISIDQKNTKEEVLLETDLTLGYFSAVNDVLMLLTADSNGFQLYCGKTTGGQLQPVLAQNELKEFNNFITGTLTENGIDYYIKNKGIYHVDFTDKSSKLVFATSQFEDLDDQAGSVVSRFDGEYYYLGLVRGEGKERILHILDRAGNQIDEIQMTIAKGDHSLYYAADADEIFLKTAKDDAFPGYVLYKADIGTDKFVPVELKRP